MVSDCSLVAGLEESALLLCELPECSQELLIIFFPENQWTIVENHELLVQLQCSLSCILKPLEPLTIDFITAFIIIFFPSISLLCILRLSLLLSLLLWLCFFRIFFRTIILLLSLWLVNCCSSCCDKALQLGIGSFNCYPKGCWISIGVPSKLQVLMVTVATNVPSSSDFYLLEVTTSFTDCLDVSQEITHKTELVILANGLELCHFGSRLPAELISEVLDR